MKADKISAVKKAEGAGAEVNRLFPNRSRSDFHDPFVLLDEFFVEPPNEFAPHEHRGFEAITYMLEGHFIHEDNLGNKAEVGPGGIQAFNAGKSITHSEKPGPEGLSRGIQLWINLPQNMKNSEPGYQTIKADQIEEESTSDLLIRKIAGQDSKLELQTEIEYLDIKVKNDTKFHDKLKTDQVGVVYLINGKIEGEYDLAAREGLLIEAGEEISLDFKEGSRLIFLKGKPHHQAIKLRGSFVE
ncbi:pirin family protein [Halanaerobium hydrogeniformans]|uniref:Pirin domain protein n=1 Tax=Halanaerobium hydrogeniformans TaxID=656519 RepID=E4RPB6_HALHG|nr:pirin family protein [Halanaerobium hydrogeniformans]ADQ13801.1 Pirin domain protein [Halanaerobium hydrogeniformans]